jgi:hypothetical protein
MLKWKVYQLFCDFQMTNYEDLPTVTLVQHEVGRYVFNKEKPE